MRILKWLGKFRRLPKKYLAIIGVVLLALGWFFIFGNRNKRQPIETATVQRQTIKEVISTSGVLAGKDSASLKFRSSGKIAYINVKVGDTVTKGQVIAGLDTQELSLALKQAQNTFEIKHATTQNIEDQLKNHSSDETFAQKDTRTQAQKAEDNAYQALLEAQRNFQDSVIYSPLDGVITQVNFVPGQVTGSDPLAQVVDFSEVYFDADVDEADIGKIKLDQKAEVVLNAYENRTFTGKITQILPQTKTTSSGATVVTVKIKLDSTDINLIPNLNGQVNIIAAQKANALTIPVEALGENNQVIIRTDQGFKQVKVTPGIRSDSDVEISLGLEEGQRVVKNPSQVNLNQRRGNNPLFRFTRIFAGPGTGGARRF